MQSCAIAQFKNDFSLRNNRLSIFHKESNASESPNRDILKKLLDQFCIMKQMNDYSQILKIIPEIRNYIKIDDAFIGDCSFLQNIYQFLIESKSDPFITEISDLITHIILMNNEIGFYFISEGIISFLKTLISKNVNYINSFFPLVRVLISLKKEFCDDILGIIPIQVFELAFQNPEFMIESGLFCSNIAKYEQNANVQMWIFKSINLLFHLNYSKSFIYLAKGLYRFSKKSNFDITSFKQANLTQFILFLFKNPQFGCIMLIENFFSKLLDKNHIQIIPEDMTKYIFKYSVNFEKTQRCVSSLTLVRKMIKSGIFKKNKICKTKIMIIYQQIFTKEEISFPIKESIAYLIFESFFYEQFTDDEVNDLIASGLLMIFEFVFIVLDNDLLNLSFQTLQILFKIYEKNRHQQKLIEEIKKSLILDLIQRELHSQKLVFQFDNFFSSKV